MTPADLEPWLPTFGAIASILTAIFTGIVAWVEITKARRGLSAEWEVTLVAGQHPSVTVAIQNSSDQTAVAHSIRARGPVASVRARRGGDYEKHPSWPPNEDGIRVDIGGGSSARASATITLDVERALRRSRQPWARLRTLAARMAWRLGNYRLPHGCEINVTAVVHPSRQAIRPRLLRHRFYLTPGYLEGLK